MLSNKLLSLAARVLLLLFISILVGTRVYLWNARTLVGNELPMPFGTGVAVVLSGSMEPELSVNDLVIIRATESYRIGDIVVYTDGHSLVIHRIVSIEGERIITQGDANNEADLPITADRIKGKEISCFPFVGSLVRFFKTPIGFILLLGAAVVLFEIPYYRERNKALSEQEIIKEEIRRLKSEL